MSNPEFLSQKYQDLPGSKPVERAVQKKIRAGEKGPSSTEDRVEAYLERLEAITDNEESSRGYELLKHKILKQFTLDLSDESVLEDIARSLYESEKRIAIERGQAGEIQQLESTQDVIEKYKPLVKEKAEIQQRTLAAWLDGLQEHKNENPMWFRYLVVRHLQKMGSLDKEKADFTRRSTKTIAPFPEFNFEALGMARRLLTDGLTEEDTEQLSEERKKEVEHAVKKKEFAKLYAVAQIETAGRLNRETTKGEWRKYDQGSDWRILENDLKGKGTGWCTAEGSAKDHLEHGDFYIYFTFGKDGKPTEPRSAIRMEQGRVAEVRGTDKRQELEPELIDIAQEKYHDLPGGEAFDKKSKDVSRLKEIYYRTFKLEKTQDGIESKSFLDPDISRDDLAFLYETNQSIDSFGLDKHPRIKEILDTRDKEADFESFFPMLVTLREKSEGGEVCTTEELQYLYEVGQRIKLGTFDRSKITDIISMRNPEADMPVVFECEPSQIARTPDQINKDTRAYVGQLETGIFQKVLEFDVEYVYTSFPERRIARQTIEVGGKTREELLDELRAKGVNISDYAKAMMEHPDFVTSAEAEDMDFIRLSVADLNIQGTPTTDAVYARAQELGLELVPPDAGPSYRLATLDQAMNDWVYMGMNQIAGPGGHPRVFDVARYDGGLWLDYPWAKPVDRWHPGHEFVFRLRKSET